MKERSLRAEFLYQPICDSGHSGQKLFHRAATGYRPGPAGAVIGGQLTSLGHGRGKSFDAARHSPGSRSSRALSHAARCGARRRRRQFRSARRRAARPGRRIRLGQVDRRLALLRLIKPPGKIEGGEAWLDGVDLLALPEKEMRRLRLAAIALVAQGAMNSLNPVLRVRHQIVDALRDHGEQSDATRRRRRASASCSSMSGCRANVADRYPHELSGGMKQRVVIAIAISLRPKVIIADEPTSALDVVVQRQVIETLQTGAGGDRRLDHPGRPRHGADGAGRRSPRRHVCRHARRGLRRRGDVPRSRSIPTASCSSPACRRSSTRAPSRASRACRRRCSTRRAAARSAPAARRRWSAARPRRRRLREVRPDRWVACHLYDMAGGGTARERVRAGDDRSARSAPRQQVLRQRRASQATGRRRSKISRSPSPATRRRSPPSSARAAAARRRSPGCSSASSRRARARSSTRARICAPSPAPSSGNSAAMCR